MGAALSQIEQDNVNQLKRDGVEFESLVPPADKIEQAANRQQGEDGGQRCTLTLLQIKLWTISVCNMFQHV